MTDHQAINGNFSRKAIMRTSEMDWLPSPSATVWRKRLELSGPAEAGRVTSIVRYDPDSRFPQHPHPDGEEILVLDGTFSDESGDYPAGSFFLNPEGFVHAPSSKDGCLLFVKLRQYPGQDRAHVLHHRDEMVWEKTETPGVQIKPFYADDRESIALIRMDAGVTLPEQTYPHGLEVFLLEGDADDGTDRMAQGDWVRYPPGSTAYLFSPTGACFYMKQGHLSPDGSETV